MWHRAVWRIFVNVSVAASALDLGASNIGCTDPRTVEICLPNYMTSHSRSNFSKQSAPSSPLISYREGFSLYSPISSIAFFQHMSHVKIHNFLTYFLQVTHKNQHYLAWTKGGKPPHDKPLSTRLLVEAVGRKGQNSSSKIVWAPKKCTVHLQSPLLFCVVHEPMIQGAKAAILEVKIFTK